MDKIADSKFFHEHWENTQKEMEKILEEAYNPNGTREDWAKACQKAMNQIDMLKHLGYGIKNGVTTH